MKLNDAQNPFKADLLSDLQPAGRLSVEQALDHYHQGYIRRLTEVLSDTFETVRWVLGTELFNKICTQYIESHPSNSYNLKDYGLSFPQYLSTLAESKERPFLEDLAHLEWLLQEVENSPTPDPLPAARTQELLNSDDFTMSFIEAMMVFQSHYSVQAIRRASKDPAMTFEKIRWNVPESLLLFKKDQAVYITALDPIEAEILLELQEGRSISEALTELVNLMPAKQLSEFFHKMMKAGVIDDISVWI